MGRAATNPGDHRREPPLRRLEGWLAAHRLAVVVAILAASALLRVVYFDELNRGPLVHQHRWDQSDMHFFDLWARKLSSGDSLMDRPFHSFFEWHESVGKAFLREYPEESSAILERYEPVGTDDDSGSAKARVLWDHWYGGKRLHQGPLYPYLIAFTYRIFGSDVRWVFAWQLALGALGNVLLYLVTRRYFGDTVGALAGLLAVLCGPVLFYEMVLLRSSLVTFLGLLLVFVTALAFERNTWAWWLLTGVVFGLALLLKTTIGPVGLGIAALLVYRDRRQLNLVLRPLLAMAAGVAICLAPAVARNVQVSVSPLALSSVGAITFICANTEDYRSEFGFFVNSRHLRPILAETECRFLPSVVATVKTHPGVGSYIGLLWGKFVGAWHWYEKGNNTNFYYYRLHSKVLAYLPVTFCILAPLGLVGLALGARRFLAAGPLYVLVLNSLAPLVIVYTLSRLRVPLAAALIPFAALTLTRLVEWTGSRRWLQAALTLAAAVAISLWTARSLPEEQMLVTPVHYKLPYVYYYQPAINAAAESAQKSGNPEDWQPVADIITESLRYEPILVREMNDTHPPRSLEEAQLAKLFGLFRIDLFRALTQQGKTERAAEVMQRAQELRRLAEMFSGRK